MTDDIEHARVELWRRGPVVIGMAMVVAMHHHYRMPGLDFVRGQYRDLASEYDAIRERLHDDERLAGLPPTDVPVSVDLGIDYIEAYVRSMYAADVKAAYDRMDDIIARVTSRADVDERWRWRLDGSAASLDGVR